MPKSQITLIRETLMKVQMDTNNEDKYLEPLLKSNSNYRVGVNDGLLYALKLVERITHGDR